MNEDTFFTLPKDDKSVKITPMLTPKNRELAEQYDRKQNIWHVPKEASDPDIDKAFEILRQKKEKENFVKNIVK